MIATGAMMTLIRNAHRHEYSVVRKPPTTGPNAAAAPAVAPHTANAGPRSGPLNVVDRIASVAGSISEAPILSMIASPAIRLPTDHETDASSEPAPNSEAPMMKIRRCP